MWRNSGEIKRNINPNISYSNILCMSDSLKLFCNFANMKDWFQMPECIPWECNKKSPNLSMYEPTLLLYFLTSGVPIEGHIHKEMYSFLFTIFRQTQISMIFKQLLNIWLERVALGLSTWERCTIYEPLSLCGHHCLHLKYI